MSAEGKKKRGVAGQTNAANSPFRLNGWAPDWQARAKGCHHSPRAASGGSHTMRGLVGGILAARLGHPMHGNYEHMFAHAQGRCTHPVFMNEGDDYE